MFNIIVAVQCTYGLPEPNKYLEFIITKLEFDGEMNNITVVHDNGVLFCVIENVDEEVYNESILEIAEYFRNLYRRGYIQYFHIGELPDDILSTVPESVENLLV